MSGPWLVLPTYNEAENVEAMVDALLPRLASAAPEHRLLIVDDNSPDGTGRIADELAGRHEAVEVLHRTGKEGLGRAYLAGFAHAIERGADLLLEMDCDFSHDPADVPRLIEAAAGADLVLGSRYIPGGGVAGWKWYRRLLSRGGSWYARMILRVHVRDLTGGFKCFHRRVLEAIDLDDIQADGYGFQIEMTYRTIQAGFEVREVPIVFHDRRAGESKMNPRIAVEAVWKVPALRRRMRAAKPSLPAGRS
jgi:dolichol-phosphate mannosyltransferase